MKEEEIALLRRATGLPYRACVEFVENASSELQSRILLASQSQSAGDFRDPIEDQEEYRDVISSATREAERIAEEHASAEEARQTAKGMQSCESASRRGVCHLIWREKKRILRDRHGLQWYSPAEMNPGIMYD